MTTCVRCGAIESSRWIEYTDGMVCYTCHRSGAEPVGESTEPSAEVPTVEPDRPSTDASKAAEAAGDADSRQCPCCHEVKPLSQFGERKMWIGGKLKHVVQSYCSPCRKDASKESSTKRKEKRAKREKSSKPDVSCKACALKARKRGKVVC